MIRTREVLPLILTLLGNAIAAASPIPEPDTPPVVERLAVLILPDRGTPASIADNLTEVVLSRIAELRPVVLVGTAEFRHRLGAGGARADTCIADLACLGHVAVALGVRRAITGTVRAEDNQHIINLVLTDIQTSKVEARFFRLVPGGIDKLVTATQEGTDDLFRPRPEPGRFHVDSVPSGARVNFNGVYVGTTPMISSPLVPGTYDVRVERDGHFPWATRAQLAPGIDLEIKLLPEQLPRKRRWPGPLTTSALVGAAISFGLGATTGTLSQLAPSGSTRREIQEDLDRRSSLATSANVAFAVGATLGIVALAVYVGYRRDIVDE